MIVVTGGAGMIGSNLIRALNKKGIKDIIVVDDLRDGTRFSNLADLDIADYRDQESFINQITEKKLFSAIKAVFHQGACSDTMEWNGRFMMENNYEFSKNLFHYCRVRAIPFIYASSAAVYGNQNSHFIEAREYERPLNVYGYSKMLFDHYVRRFLPDVRSPVCGLRYFNVYGPREKHKKSMASVAFHFNEQIKNGENLKLFEGSEQFKRDFIHVDDVVAVNLWAWENHISGIFNCGTGHAESFVAVADAVLRFHQKGKVEYCPFPEALKDRYQSFTEADLTSLRRAGYDHPFKNVAQGVDDYMRWLAKN